VEEGRSFFVARAAVPGPEGTVPTVFVRTSTDRFVRDLENVRWLFSSIFLLGGAAFFVLAKYLTQTILLPLEDIRRAARNLADGEPDVRVPEIGDDEIAELGGIIRTLGDSRRHSRILSRPRPGYRELGPEPAPPGEASGADRSWRPDHESRREGFEE
jgi:HAMP domain-containing protein